MALEALLCDIPHVSHCSLAELETFVSKLVTALKTLFSTYTIPILWF
jgi:hypothetical protein